jgi:myo-inositol-1(or 4)-monophosphatase
MSEIAERLQFAVEIAREAGDGTLRYFRRAGLAVEQKVDRSPVTIADRSAEELLRQRIDHERNRHRWCGAYGNRDRSEATGDGGISRRSGHRRDFAEECPQSHLGLADD